MNAVAAMTLAHVAAGGLFLAVALTMEVRRGQR